MLSVKQGDNKYQFLSLWYDLTWDWTQVSQTIGKHSTQSNKYTEVSINTHFLCYLFINCLKRLLYEYFVLFLY